MKTYNYEIRPIITGSTEANSEAEAIEKIKTELKEYPHEITDVDNSEISLKVEE